MAKQNNKKNSSDSAGPVVRAPKKYDKSDSVRKKNGGAGKKTTPKKGAVKPAEKGPGFIAKTRQFFREVRIELKKVTWPSRKETIASTSVVIVVVFLVATYLGLVDIGLSRALKLLFR